MPARIHEKEGKERKGRNQGPEKNVRIASAKGGIRDTLFIPFPSSFPFLFVSFFFLFLFFTGRRDCEVVSGMLRSEKKIGAVGEKGSLQKGREVFVNEKREKKKRKKKSRIGWKPPPPPPPPSEMNI